jgi:phage terminase large subunit
MPAAARREWRNLQQFWPYQYQEPFLGALVSGAYRHLVIVWNRRAGKDKAAINGCYQRMEQRVGNYVHVFPTGPQGRKDVWRNIDSDGFRTIDHFPAERVRKRLDGEMLIELKNGSTYQVMGSDEPDRIRGSNPVGIIWSEYALMKPSVRFVTRTILDRNGGWEVYAFTPKGTNHAKVLYDTVKDDAEWFVEICGNDVTHTYSAEQTAKMLKDGIPQAWVDQEVFCSFVGPMVGAYYGKAIEKADREGRVAAVPWNKELPVETWWDIGIGINDATAVWFVQIDGPWFNVLRYVETHGDGLPEWAKRLRELPYAYSHHRGPHDVRHHEWGLGRQAGTRADVARGLGINFEPVPGPKAFARSDYILEGIRAGVALVDRCRFDAEGTAEGLEVLRNYRAEQDERKSRGTGEPFFKDHPLHDWASHGADAWRYGAIAQPHRQELRPEEHLPANADYLTRLQAARERSSNTLSRNYRRGR